jgi:type IX secretion system substrate protein
MRTFLHARSLALGAFILISSFSQAQDRFAYAITDVQQNSAGWTSLRKLNLQTGIYTDVLFNGMNPSQVVFDATTKKQIEVAADAKTGMSLQSPFTSGVAAIAYDSRNNRIYFTPMFIDQLRYIDLKTMKVYYVTDQAFTSLGNLHNDEGKIVTRMAIAPDGYGYAVTNDASTFIRFSTGKNLQIEQLGGLVDDPNNTGISIHNRCSSWGGDMIADDAGNLYLFSAHNSVFKINIESKVATWLGIIQGLPATYTINGAVVTDDGKLLTGSQAYAQGWFEVDPKTWTATEYKAPNGIFLTSDLANSNIMTTKKNATTELPPLTQRATLLNDHIQVFPNPVSNFQFTVQFSKLAKGDYTVEVTDISGKQVTMRKVNVDGVEQTENFTLAKTTAQGIYMVKVTDWNNKSLFNQKLFVQ